MTQSEEFASLTGAPANLHPLTLVFSLLGAIRALVVPAIVTLLASGERGPSQWVGWIFAVIAVPMLIIAVLEYFAFSYRLGTDELVIDSGIFQRHHRVIPLQRVQNVDLRESALQRLCGVVTLHVETAGTGADAEAKLEVLSRVEAEALRAELLVRRRAAPQRREATEVPAQVLARLGFRELAIAGATANRAGLIAAGLVALLRYAEDIPVARFLPTAELLDRIDNATLLGAIWLIAAAIGMILIVGWLLSIVASLVSYYDFTLERTATDLRKRYGFPGRTHTTLPLERIQGVQIEESLLRRPLGLAMVRVDTAGGALEGGQDGSEVLVPITVAGGVSRLLREVFPELDLAGAQVLSVHPRSRRRMFVRYLVTLVSVVLVFIVVRTFLGGGAVTAATAAGIAGAAALAWVSAAWQYRHRGYALLPGYVLARGGVFNRITWIVPDRKIQTVHMTATPFQRRHGLASIVIDTAGRNTGVMVDLGADTAARVLAELAARGRRSESGTNG